jgi:hypothetical protein
VNVILAVVVDDADKSHFASRSGGRGSSQVLFRTRHTRTQPCASRHQFTRRSARSTLAGSRAKSYSTRMSPLRARVENGRLLLDEPTDLPDGTVLDLVADDQGDDLTDEERRALHEALSASAKSAEAGHLRHASEILDELRQRR